MKTYYAIVVIAFLILGCKSGEDKKTTASTDVQETFTPKTDHQLREVSKAVIAPKVDGNSNDPVWETVQWNPLDQPWLGDEYTAQDFQGRYKLAWTPEALYLLAEIQDDIIYDQHEDPLKLWWDDDCLEIFIDADNSGGGHQYTHNAFAYHVALDGNVVDMAPGEVPTLYNSHVRSRHITKGKTTLWECAITIYEDSFIDGGVNDAKILAAGQKMGFALAYCDNDTSKERENFVGSVAVAGEDKNRGWIDAGIFGTILLKE